ncbi:flagellar hook-basal body protein [Paenibacillaceae bacterium]|nr:flagellar hook-basal body protein [Paenibacillaceae bacterium]
MNSSMISAMASMNGMQQKFDLLAENIANINTVGYKSKNASFQDLLTTLYKQEDSFQQPSRFTPPGFNQGWGSRLTMMQPDFSQGALLTTGKENDLAIEGNALFEVQVDGDGGRAYTRNGDFQYTVTDNTGNMTLTTNEGYPVIAQRRNAQGVLEDISIVIPKNHQVRIDADGQVTAVSADGLTERDLGRLKLVQPTKPAVLTAVDDNLFVIAPGLNQDDVVRTILPGDGTEAAVRQGFLEQSNVQLADQMTELMIVQRAYQMSARALTSSDTMMGLANNLRG